jgi:hypothetical protein
MTATTLQRLLKYPHTAVFDTSPDAAIAMRLQHPSGASWVVVDEILTATAIGVSHTYDLTQFTLATLATALTADGFDVVYLSSDFADFGASVLVDGSGNQGDSNGDHLTAFTSPLWAILGGYARELRAADDARGQALRQMIIGQAEDFWLDYWADLFGIPRNPGEEDSDLQIRLPAEVMRKRVNGLAIEQTVKDLTGQDVWIDEPWKRRFTLDSSALSGGDHFSDGQYYAYHVIQPVGNIGTDWTGIKEIVERNKAAGVIVYDSRVDLTPIHVVVPFNEYHVSSARTDIRGSWLSGVNDQMLDVMRLSDSTITINHKVARTDDYFIAMQPVILLDGTHWLDGSYSLGDPGDMAYIGLWPHQSITPYRSIAMAAIALSDSPALGNENAIFGRGQDVYDFSPEPSLSAYAVLDGYESILTQERVEAITLNTLETGVTSSFTGSAYLSQITATGCYAVPEIYSDTDNSWTGAWDTRTWHGWRNVGLTITSTVGTTYFTLDGSITLDGSYILNGYKGD